MVKPVAQRNPARPQTLSTRSPGRNGETHIEYVQSHVSPRRLRAQRPALRHVDETMRRKPLPSVALALVLGFLLASLATPAR